MNLYKDNYKYMTRDISDMQGNHKQAKKRKLIALFRDSFENFYIKKASFFETSYEAQKNIVIQKRNYNNAILPTLYDKYKSKDLTTRNFIMELLKSKDKSNIIMAHEIIKSENK